MWRLTPVAVFLWLFAAIIPGASATELLYNDFSSPALDQSQWCSCQIDDKNTPVTFSADSADKKDYIAGITVNESSLGGKKCEPACKAPQETLTAQHNLLADFSRPEFLGTNFFAKAKPTWAPAAGQPDPYCDEDAWRRVKAAQQEGECIQREELRLQKTLFRRSDVPLVYSFRFRMQKEVLNDKDSIRWITAQWKQEPISGKYGQEFANWSPSPFLAQRYDDGILHVTVQDDMCRCLIASALARGSNLAWTNGTPHYCQSIRPEDSNGKACTPDLKVEYGRNPILSTPAGKWVEMRYRVQAGRDGNAFIEIHQDGRFIARVTGKIGYEPDPLSSPMTKFKIGQYRDYIPSSDTLELDWIRIEAAGN
ncbi:heparin lyase I family protein [Rhizobium sp. BR 362]|uniref:heparin lyase I family protein n=1 Tax=Rhizobium sp. BR 362 TaxID=3040670 RepID=UPI002F423B67